MIIDQIYSYFERDEDMHVLFIFDSMDYIGLELCNVVWKEGYRYVVFDGRWFTTKYLLHTEWSNDKVVLLFPPERQVVYPNDEKERLKFPLLGELEAGGVLHGDNSLDFMSQHHIDAKYERYVSSRINELNISRVESMLKPYYESKTFSLEVADRAIVSYMLDSDRLLEWNEIILRTLMFGCSTEKKRRDIAFNRIGKRPAISTLLNNKLQEIFGVAYDENSTIKVDNLIRIWKYNLICRSLPANPNDDYKELKVTSSLGIDRMFSLLSLAKATPATAEKFEMLMSELGNSVREAQIIDCYGIDAPYSYVPQSMCLNIVEKTICNGIAEHYETVINRMESLMLRQPGNTLVERLTAFVSLTASYYELASKVVSQLRIDNADEYIRQYSESFYQHDTLYRRALEKYYLLSTEGLEIADALTLAKRRLDADYHEFIGVMGMEWSDTVKNEGKEWHFETLLTRQENFYTDHVKDFSARQMIIVSDALRYEVAREMLGEMFKRSKQKHEMHMECMVGMLPSETKFSKVSLLPHSKMTLTADGTSLDDGPILEDIKSRENHVQKYNPESRCFNFSDLQNDSNTNREKLKGHKLVYIFHDVIDSAGHNDDGESLISACRRTVNELSEFVLSSLATYNFEKVIVTSDHGFLFNDIIIQEKDKQTITEEASERKSRYYLTTSDTEIINVAKYNGVAVPIGTNRFAAQGATYKFAHGGSSLQEIVIPLIVASRGREKVSEQRKVQIMLLGDKRVIESSVLQLAFIQKDAVSYDLKKMRIRFGLYDGDKLVSDEKELDIDRADTDATSRIYSQSLTLSSGVNASILELRVYDVEDNLNPIIKEKVMNKTLIERDF